MELEVALTTYILSKTGLTSLIGDRFYYDSLPQGKNYPAVVCMCIDDIPIHTHNGISNYTRPNYQFTVYASTRAGAKAVSKQIKLALSDYAGSMSGLNIQYISLINELPNTEISTDGTIKKHTVDLEFEIIYTRSD
jgi:Protein of unknown function (DUF3168).